MGKFELCRDLKINMIVIELFPFTTFSIKHIETCLDNIFFKIMTDLNAPDTRPNIYPFTLSSSGHGAPRFESKFFSIII